MFGKHPDIEEAQRSLAYLYQKAKKPETAIVVLNRQIKQSKENNDHRGVILGYFLKGHCYKTMKKYDNACECLQKMIDCAVQHKEKDLEAMACKFLGEYHLSMDSHYRAEEFLTRAVTRFMEVGQISEAARCSIHAGAVKAARHMATYAKLIIRAKNQDDAKELLRWQLTEDPEEWEQLAATLLSGRGSFSQDEDDEGEMSQKNKKKMLSKQTSLTKAVIPDHPRIWNSMVNASDVQLVESEMNLE